MIRRPPRSTQSRSSAASDVYKRQSPLVRSIAAREGISYTDLDKTSGTGMDGRITKDDILKILEERNSEKESLKSPDIEEVVEASNIVKPTKKETISVSGSQGDEIIPMDRIRKIIAEPVSYTHLRAHETRHDI